MNLEIAWNHSIEGSQTPERVSHNVYESVSAGRDDCRGSMYRDSGLERGDGDGTVNPGSWVDIVGTTQLGVLR